MKAIAALPLLILPLVAHADFPNLSGNAHVNGSVNAVGPLYAAQTWSRTNMTCLIL